MNKIIKIDRIQADDLLANYKNRDQNLYLLEENGQFMAIDNSSNEGFTETFATEEIAIDWLHGEFQIENLDLYLADKANLNNLRNRLIELDAKKSEISAYYEELRDVKQQLAEIQGFDTYFQNPISGEVFKIFKPTNKVVYFDEVEYKRTAKENEPSQGRLSKKEAKEQGFEVT